LHEVLIFSYVILPLYKYFNLQVFKLLVFVFNEKICTTIKYYLPRKLLAVRIRNCRSFLTYIFVRYNIITHADNNLWLCRIAGGPKRLSDISYRSRVRMVSIAYIRVYGSIKNEYKNIRPGSVE